MYPSLEYVLTKRYLLTLLARGTALALFVIGTVPLIRMAIEGVILPFDPSVRMGVRRGTDWVKLILTYLPDALQFIVPGLILLYYHQPIVRWLAPMPKPRCPECGYWIKRGGGLQCPECGSALPKALVERDEVAV